MRPFSGAKSYRVSFRFTPKLSDQVVIITEESDFYTRYCRNKLHDSRKEKTGICKAVVIATVVAIRDVVEKGIHCSLFAQNSYIEYEIIMLWFCEKLRSLLIVTRTFPTSLCFILKQIGLESLGKREKRRQSLAKSRHEQLLLTAVAHPCIVACDPLTPRALSSSGSPSRTIC